MPANYQFLEALGGTTFFGGWRRPFYVTSRFDAQPYITIGYRSRYATQDRAASVRVNQVQVARLAPRPWQPGEFILRTEEVTLPFEADLLTPGVLRENVVEIVNVPPDTDNYIFIRSAAVHYRE
jgi:hypothetical protein